MRKLPSNIQSKISPNLTVVYWTRRAVFEVVEEVSESLFNGFCTLVIGRAIEPTIDYMVSTASGSYNQSAYWMLLWLITLMAARRGIHELFLWTNEVYIVCVDQNNGGGRVYKFWGWPVQVYVHGAITQSWPIPLTNVGEPQSVLMFYSIWGWLTGERMVRLHLYVAELKDKPLIEGKRVPPLLESVIDRIRGHKPRPSGGNAGLDAVNPLSHALWTGIMSREEAIAAYRSIVHKAVHQGEL